MVMLGVVGGEGSDLRGGTGGLFDDEDGSGGGFDHDYESLVAQDVALAEAQKRSAESSRRRRELGALEALDHAGVSRRDLDSFDAFADSFEVAFPAITATMLSAADAECGRADAMRAQDRIVALALAEVVGELLTDGEIVSTLRAAGETRWRPEVFSQSRQASAI